ncbi:TlpA family protein disulfide reductase [Ekhidna sp.]|uniref:TlpA family protein disulfide reductase n=1 Tax=Ekhidna sp. TaxID=2608089 RepID=UPI003B50976B
MKIANPLSLAILIFLFNACSNKHSTDENKQLIENILTNLRKVQTAGYITTMSTYNIYDTMKPVYVSDHYFKEYINVEDTFVGASFVRLNIKDTTKMEYSYDGIMRSRVHWEEGTMEIDSFRTMRFPWREVPSPFFTRAKIILDYINETNDSISYKVSDFVDSLAINLVIYDTVNVVDFMMGNQSIYFPEVSNAYEMDFSRYTIWVRKTDLLPYKIKRDLPHNISIESTRQTRINNDNISNFLAKKYFPDLPLREKNSKPLSLNLKGTKAPNWSLLGTKDEIISLEDFRGRMVLIEFTGIGCGPCHAAIPFLKQLVNEGSIEVVSIETWTKDLNIIKRYQEKQKLNFKILKSDKLVENQYSVQSVPQFYILDRNHKILEIIQGYSKENTNEKIRELINQHSM